MTPPVAPAHCCSSSSRCWVTTKVRQGFFGQEVNLTTYNLCRINMFLHDVNFEKFDIAHGDTLTDPVHWDD